MRLLAFYLALFGVFATSAVSFADVVAARTLRKGTVLSASDLKATMPKSDELKKSLIGGELKRSVYVGRGLHVDDIGPVTVVRRNDIVRLFFSFKGMGLRTEARALGSGGVGETIQVMNMDTRVTVFAKVTGAKRAEVIR